MIAVGATERQSTTLENIGGGERKGRNDGARLFGQVSGVRYQVSGVREGRGVVTAVALFRREFSEDVRPET